MPVAGSTTVPAEGDQQVPDVCRDWCDVVASTISLVHSLGLRMVAEGVEDDVTYSELARLGCAQAQGYYMCRPVPAAELGHWLSSRGQSDKLLGVPGLVPTAVLD